VRCDRKCQFLGALQGDHGTGMDRVSRVDQDVYFMFLSGYRVLESARAGQRIIVRRLELLVVGNVILGSQGVPFYWLPLGKPWKCEKGVQTASAAPGEANCWMRLASFWSAWFLAGPLKGFPPFLPPLGGC